MTEMCHAAPRHGIDAFYVIRQRGVHVHDDSHLPKAVEPRRVGFGFRRIGTGNPLLLGSCNLLACPLAPMLCGLPATRWLTTVRW